MTRYGVSIEKVTPFRNGSQHSANVYYYEIPITPVSGSPELSELIDKLVAKEKAFMTSSWTWTRGRAWSQIGSPAQNDMLVDKALSGTGALTPHSQIDKERAVLIRFRAGNDSRGRPVYLRKWFHIDATVILGSTISNGAIKQDTGLTTAQRTAGEVIGNDLKSIGVGAGGLITCSLVAKNGRAIDGATQTHPFYEHHQLGDEWRNV